MDSLRFVNMNSFWRRNYLLLFKPRWVSQSELSESISYAACEHKLRTDLSFEAKQIQFPPEVHHMMWRKNVLPRIIKNDL